MTRETIRDWVRALERAEPTEQWTMLCFFLYAQVVQADAASNRNVLLLHRCAVFEQRDIDEAAPAQRDRVGSAAFSEKEIQGALAALGLPGDLQLSALAVELLPGGTPSEMQEGSVEVGAEAKNLGYGLVTMINVPGAGPMQLYQPLHPVAYALPDN